MWKKLRTMIKRTEAKTREQLYSVLEELKAEKADIISVDKYAGRYVVKSQSLEDAERDAYKEDYKRLRRMEKRINTYPDLKEAVRAAMEHEDNKIDFYLNRHSEALKGSSPQSPPEQDSHHGLP